MCNFSGFSKRIPSLEHPRVACALPAGHPVDTLQGDLDHAKDEKGALYRAHIWHITIASHRLEIVLHEGHTTD